jgi:flagellar FliL protein
MADALQAKPEAPKKGRLARLLVPILLILAGAAAGAAGAILLPPLVPGLSPHAEAPKAPEPKVAPLEYVEIDNNFTANLRDSGRFVQVRVAISTQGGQPVVDAIARHRVAIVAAVLSVLSETPETEIYAPGGREALTRRMQVAINDVLQRKSGIAGVDDVFLTSFVLQ